jgi:hypothetical protein
MKKVLLITVVLIFGVSLFAQQRAYLSKEKRNEASLRPAHPIKDVANTNAEYIPGTKSANLIEEEQIGTTIYDLQTNSSTQNRIFLYDDGTIAATWTMGFTSTAFPERGTGYNYYDGTAWGDDPTTRIENVRTGWPSYSPWGENGEIVANHTDLDGLWVGHRDQKGTGTWTSTILGGPAGVVDVTWPRITTTGINRDVIHTIYCTWPSSGPYMGQEAVVLYSRSNDGGQSWDILNHFFDELGPDYYTTMNGDTYEFAEPKDGILAFLIGDSWIDLALMKSTDDGETWAKTVIWENPYPLHVTGQVTDTFYCADGAHHLAIDNSGLVHVVFGINRAYADAAGEYWFPLVDGVGYWNENRPTFSNTMDALNPYGEAGSELVSDYSLIGYAQDVNENGTWDILGEVGTYYVGASSHPQITIDQNNEIYFIFDGVTETYNNGTQDYRHLWARYSPNGDFWGPFVDLTSDLIHIFDECVYPSVSPTSDDYFHLVYMTDIEPGIAVNGDADPYGDNYTKYMKVLKEDIKVGIKENHETVSNENVSQNYPNPFRGSSLVYVMLDKAASLSLEVTNLMGQVVYLVPEKQYPAGKAELAINANGLDSGIYFYTIRSGEKSVTKKMMIE